jgi:signal transduction histidine kinase
MKHIGIKFFIGFLCMAGLTIVLLWLIQAGIMKNSYENERVNNIKIALQQASVESSADFALLEEKLNARFLLLDNEGNTTYMSQGMPMMGKMYRQMQMLPEPDGQLGMMSGMNGNVQYAVIGYPIKEGGAIYAIFSLADVQEAARILQGQLWIITVSLIVFAVIMAVLLARKFSKPVRRITEAAHILASGNLDINLPVTSKDELGQLTVALNDLGKQLKATEKLRKELIANVSHELRAPLSVIQGYAETVRDVTWTDADKRTGQLTIIAEEAGRLSRMVSNILDYSRLQAGVEKLYIKDFAVIPVLEKIIELHELDASTKNIKIKLECPDISVRFDPSRFEQVVVNLLNNALKYAENDSDIVINVESIAKAARIFVKNKGPVIPEDQLDHVWDRYYRVQGDPGSKAGAGFGLSIVKSIMELHGTAYGVKSALGETEFWFETQGL